MSGVRREGEVGGGALSRAFHLKIFGSLHHRYLSLAVSRTESDIVRGLKACTDHSVRIRLFTAQLLGFYLHCVNGR